jgi:hypothetical protein
MNCLSAGVEDRAYIIDKNANKKCVQLSDFIFWSNGVVEQMRCNLTPFWSDTDAEFYLNLQHKKPCKSNSRHARMSGRKVVSL